MSKTPKKVDADQKPTEVVDAPIKKAFSIERGLHGWVMVEYTLAGDVVTEVKRQEPDLKASAVNAFKKAAFLYWSSIG